MRIDRFLVLGAASGALSATLTLIPLGALPAPVVLGYCLGLGAFSACDGIEAGFYIFPGLVFGLLVAAMLRRERRLAKRQAVLFVLASGVANAVAVSVCLALLDPLSVWFRVPDLYIAIAGAAAGAVGGFLLTAVARGLLSRARSWRPVAVAAVLGLTVVALAELEVVGTFLFYIVWQAGYAAALAARLPAQARR